MNLIIGTVTETNPLGVFAMGQQLDPQRIWMNEFLCTGFVPNLAGHLKGTGYMGASVTVQVAPTQLSVQETSLTVGARVLLGCSDHQDYYILAKVVRNG